MKVIEVKTHDREEFIDITSAVENVVKESGKKDGICFIYVPHTTAGITINENADPSVKRDILMAINKLIPYTWEYQHSEGNSPAHIKSSIIGQSVSLIIENGRLVLGTWQGIFFCEFDGPRTRKVYVKIL
ncbi:secondary thiamine-phosphate synthase enzyme YjbQ [SCandidatus Aminicenantes bacterium Aminicenantia_JdfR_composite]|nr:secondary thiamine-phosphate synthase enzyme YjbQ [SCandidatus Aminicenantes bacterium Aminicenantia_JdfR_composite]MCP2606381.1 secondary thiamine-phosphate synthase enzyme YjbQ [Candidatus Aminicenantes bacterium AC-708-I09]